MKNALLLLFLIPAFSQAQTPKADQARYYLNRVQFYGAESIVDDIHGFGNELTSKQCEKVGVRKITIERGKNEKNLEQIQYELSDFGLIKKIVRDSDSTFYTYLNDSLVETINVIGKISQSKQYEYTNGLLKKKEVFQGDRLTERVLMDYNDSDKLLFSLYQNGRKLKNTYAMSYEYYDDKISKQQFMVNDKVLKSWDYSCDPKGEDVQAESHSTICKEREESSDGSYIEHVRKVENGEVMLFTYCFDKDGFNYKSSCERENGLKVWEANYTKSVSHQFSYSKKGKLAQHYITKHDDQGRMIETETIYGKRQNKSTKMINSYNEMGLISTKKTLYGDKLIYVRHYNYEV